MAISSKKTAKQTLASRSLPARLGITWQLLGYKRYLTRDSVAQIVAASYTETALSQSSVTCTTSTDMHETADIRTSIEPELPVLSPYVFGLLNLFDCQTFTLCIEKNSTIIWCFPALWRQHGRFTLFAQENERKLWQNALKVMGYSQSSENFSAVPPYFEVAPRLDSRQVVQQIFSMQSSGVIVLLGHSQSFEILELAAQANKEFWQLMRMIHPAVACISAKKKYQLWQDFLSLWSLVCEK